MALVCQSATRPWLEKHLTPMMEANGLHWCCGDGEETLQIASLLGEHCNLLGIDEDEVMIETARQKQALSGLDRVHFSQAGLYNWSTDTPYDFIYTRVQTIAAPEPEQWLAEVLRKLKSDGILLVEIFYLPRCQMYPYNHAFARAMELIGRLGEDQPYGSKQFPELLEKAGFINMEKAYAAPTFMPRACNRIASLSLECYRTEILRRGDSNRAELNALLLELRALEQEPDTLLSRPGMLQFMVRGN
jgi:ubiquinone/menaquinone biosynthesis C-methylase UbiE